MEVRMRLVCVWALLGAALLVAAPRSAAAQNGPARSSVTAALGAVNFDVDGTATTLGIAGRGSAAMTSRLAVEGNVSWARNDETGTSDLWVVDAQLHYYWGAGSRIRPYAGGGAGLFINHDEFFTDKALTLSAAGGLRVDVTDRVAATGEFRIRGVEADFAGSLAEFWGGLTIRLGR
jgi:hypothetical protein